MIFNVITTYWIFHATLFGAVAAFVVNSVLMAMVFWVFYKFKKTISNRLRYLFFIIVIFFFIFFTVRFYFSDENQKNSYRSILQLDKKIKDSEKDLFLLKNNTENIIEFVEYKNSNKNKKFSFWKLIYNDE